MAETHDPNDVDESIGLFEAALKAKPVELPVPELERILVVPDRSDQADFSRALGQALGDLTMAPVTVRDDIPGTGEANGAAAGILEVVEKENAGLLVVPAPYGDDLGALQGESLSVTIDMLLLESPVPLLIAREPQADAGARRALSNPLLLVDWDAGRQNALGRWGRLLAKRGGSLRAVAVPDPEIMEAIAFLVGEDEEGLRMKEALVSRAESRLAGDLVAALQKAGDQDDFAVKFEIRRGRAPGVLAAEAAADDDHLLVVAYKRNQGSASFGHARTALLESRQPVLAIGV